jgi:hypothetical protein
MKKFLPILIFAVQVMAVQTIFQDNFTVSGGGNINFQYDVIGRQTGAEAPADYYHPNGPSTVTNAGANAGKCKMDGTPLDSWLSPGGNFNQSADYSIKFELTRLFDSNKTFYFSFGKNAIYQPANSADPGMGIIFYENGFYQLFDSNTLVFSQHFSALEAASNPSLSIEISVSNSTFVTLTIDGTKYPLRNSGDIYTYEYTDKFENNYITFIALQTEITLDNFTITDNKNYSFNNDRFQFTKTGEEISGALSFTNINFPDGGNIMCYDNNPIIPGHNIYAPDFIRMSNFWRGYCGGWLTNGQVNDNIYICDSPSLDLEGPWPTPQYLITQGSYNHANDPSVAIYNGTWYMFYSAAPYPGTGDETINYSTSPDGINWTPSVATPTTALTITDIFGIADAEITDVARPSIVFAPECVKLWFDGFLTNDGGKSAEVYLAEADYSNLTYFVIKKRYGHSGGAITFIEPDVALRADGTYFAAYNHQFKEIRYATSTDGYNFTEINANPVVRESNPDCNFPGVNNPGLFYDDINDEIYGMAFGMTSNTVVPMDNKIGVGYMQYIIRAFDTNNMIWRIINSGAPYSTLQSFNSVAENFSKFQLVHPITQQVLYEQNVTAAKNEIWQLQLTPFSSQTWSNNADSLISDAKNYTHKINLNSSTAVIVNNVTFPANTSGTLSGSNWSLNSDNTNGSFGWIQGMKGNNLSGSCSNLVENFCFENSAGNPNPTSVDLTGLIPNKEYIFSVYSRGFEAGGRASLFTAADGGGRNIIAQNEFGQDNGQIVRYKYIADPGGTFSIILKPQDAGWHWYAFCNEERNFLSPTNLNASQGIFTNIIEVNWDGYSGADFYVYRSTNDSAESSIDISGRLQSTNFVDTTAGPDIIYYYRIKTAIGDDKSDFSDSAAGWLQIPEPGMFLIVYFGLLICTRRKIAAAQ